MVSLRTYTFKTKIIAYSIAVGFLLSLISFGSNWLMLIHEDRSPTTSELIDISFYFFVPLISWTVISVVLLAFADRWSRQLKLKKLLWMALIGLLLTPVIRALDILLDFSIKYLLGMIQANPFDVLNDVWLVVISSTPAGFFRLVIIGAVIHYLFNRERKADSFAIKSKYGAYHILNKDEIIYLQSDGNYLDIYTTKDVYCTRMTLKSFEDLGGNDFYRIHKSTIVNANHISQFRHWRNGEYLLIMSNDKPLTSSKSYKKTIDIIKKSLMKDHPGKSDPIGAIARPTTG